jgi:hypothetical protein
MFKQEGKNVNRKTTRQIADEVGSALTKLKTEVARKDIQAIESAFCIVEHHFGILQGRISEGEQKTDHFIPLLAPG